MKKLIIQILVCVPVGIFAQELPGVDNIKNDNINNSYANFETAHLGNNKVVLTSANEDLTYNQDDYSRKNLLDPFTGKINDDEGLLLEENLLEDTKAYYREGMVSYTNDRKTVFFSVNKKIKNKKRKNEKEVKIK